MPSPAVRLLQIYGRDGQQFSDFVQPECWIVMRQPSVEKIHHYDEHRSPYYRNRCHRCGNWGACCAGESLLEESAIQEKRAPKSQKAAKGRARPRCRMKPRPARRPNLSATWKRTPRAESKGARILELIQTAKGGEPGRDRKSLGIGRSTRAGASFGAAIAYTKSGNTFSGLLLPLARPAAFFLPRAGNRTATRKGGVNPTYRSAWRCPMRRAIQG
jgi:hypothetical protein